MPNSRRGSILTRPVRKCAVVLLCAALLPVRELTAQTPGSQPPVQTPGSQPPGQTPAGKYTPDPATQKARNDLDRKLKDNAQALTDHTDPKGKQVPLVVQEGLVLIQETYKAQLNQFLEILDAIRESGGAAQDGTLNDLQKAAEKVGAAAKAYADAVNKVLDSVEKQMGIGGGPFAAASISRGMQLAYQKTLQEAQEAMAAGDAAKAQRLVEEARSSNYGQMIETQREFVRALDQNPLLGVEINGVKFYQALLNNANASPADRRALLQQYVAHASAQAQAELIRVVEMLTIAQLWEFFDPKYQKQRDMAGTVCGGWGTTYINGLKAYYEGYTGTASVDNAAISLAIDFVSIAALVGAMVFVPFAVPFVVVFMAGKPVAIATADLLAAADEEGKARQSAPLTGYQPIQNAKDKQAAAFNQLMFELGLIVVGIATAYAAHEIIAGLKNGTIRFIRTGLTLEEEAAIRQAAERGATSLAPELVGAEREELVNRIIDVYKRAPKGPNEPGPIRTANAPPPNEPTAPRTEPMPGASSGDSSYDPIGAALRGREPAPGSGNATNKLPSNANEATQPLPRGPGDTQVLQPGEPKGALPGGPGQTQRLPANEPRNVVTGGRETPAAASTPPASSGTARMSPSELRSQIDQQLRVRNGQNWVRSARAELDRQAAAARAAGVPEAEVNRLVRTADQAMQAIDQIPDKVRPAQAKLGDKLFVLEDTHADLVDRAFRAKYPNAFFIDGDAAEMPIIRSVRAKAQLEAQGKPQRWTQSEIDTLNRLKNDPRVGNTWERSTGLIDDEPGYRPILDKSQADAVKAVRLEQLQRAELPGTGSQPRTGSATSPQTGPTGTQVMPRNAAGAAALPSGTTGPTTSTLHQAATATAMSLFGPTVVWSPYILGNGNVVLKSPDGNKFVQANLASSVGEVPLVEAWNRLDGYWLHGRPYKDIDWMVMASRQPPPDDVLEAGKPRIDARLAYKPAAAPEPIELTMGGRLDLGYIPPTRSPGAVDTRTETAYGTLRSFARFDDAPSQPKVQDQGMTVTVEITIQPTPRLEYDMAGNAFSAIGRWLLRPRPAASASAAWSAIAPRSETWPITSGNARAAQVNTGDTSLGIRAVITSLGNSQGEAFQLQIINDSSKPLRIPKGTLVVEPLAFSSRETQRTLQQVAPQLKGAVSTTLEGYCLNYSLLPPEAGMQFRIAPPAKQLRYAPAGKVLDAATRLSEAGKLTPDSDPKLYLESIRQYAVWTRLENWDVKKFTDAFVDRTRKNVAAVKGNWTKQLETAVRAAAPGRWRDVSAVLAESAR